MPNAFAAPVPVFRDWDNNGNPLINGQLFTYAAGTTNPIATYTDATAGTANTNPVILNSRGEAPVFLLPNTAYKFVLEDSRGNLIWSEDQIFGSQLLTLYAGTDTGTSNNYVLTYNAPFTTYAGAQGQIIYFIPANSNTGPSTVNINTLGPVPIVNPNGTPLAANEISANQIAAIVFNTGSFYLIQGASQGIVSYTGTDTGTANNYILPMTGQYFSYTAGNTLFWVPAHTNTGASTVNVKGLGSVAISGPFGGALIAGSLIAGQLTEMIYNGTFFQIVFPAIANGSITLTSTGGTTAPTMTVFYYVNGGSVTLMSTGVAYTAALTTFTLTGFANGLQGQTQAVTSPLLSAIDNSATGVSCYLTIPNQIGGSTVIVTINNTTGTWTAAGTRRLNGFCFTYILE
jgi:hypothetical protein